MPLVQIVVNNSNNNTYFATAITGKCSVRVLSVQYTDTSAAIRVLRLQSDNLIFNYSPQTYLTWMTSNPTKNYGTANQTFDVSRSEYHAKDLVFNGQLLVNIVQQYSSDNSALPAPFYCVITLDVEQIGQEFR